MIPTSSTTSSCGGRVNTCNSSKWFVNHQQTAEGGMEPSCVSNSNSKSLEESNETITRIQFNNPVKIRKPSDMITQWKCKVQYQTTSEQSTKIL